MKAIILAAGYGKRLAIESPKALIEVKGISLLNRLIKSLRSIGLEDITAIIGYNEDQFKNQTIKYEINPVWDKSEESYSLFCIKDKINEDIIVIAGHILVSRNVIKKVAEAEGDICVLGKGSSFGSITKLSKKACGDLLSMTGLVNLDMRKAIIKLVVGKKYKVNQIKLEKKERIYNIDTKDDVLVVRKRVGEVIL